MVLVAGQSAKQLNTVAQVPLKIWRLVTGAPSRPVMTRSLPLAVMLTAEQSVTSSAALAAYESVRLAPSSSHKRP